MRPVAVTRNRKKTKLKPTLPQATLLLVKFLLIKIGSAPLLAISMLTKLRLPIIPRKYKIIASTLFLVSCFFLYTLFTIQAARSLPSPQKLISNEPLTTEFFDRNGTLLYRLYEGRNRTLVNLNDLPKHLIQATIAIEDKNFYSHPGFDLQAIIRAAINNLQKGQQQGASTITQQLIKNTLLTPEKSFSRKFKEIFLAFWAERIYSKDEILQMYFNEAPYGGPAWGIEAASETYFGKSAHNLTLAESTFLAGLPVSPTEFSPYGSRPELAKARQQQVLERMVKDKYITKPEADETFSEELALLPRSNQIKAPHFVMFVRDLLSQKYGPRVVSQGGLKIYTTLDLELQEKTEEIVKNEISNLSNLNSQNAALASLAAASDQAQADGLKTSNSPDTNFPQSYINFISAKMYLQESLSSLR